MIPKTLLIGCGYIGLPLALHFIAEGHQVTGWVHSEASAAALAGHPFRRVIVGSVGNSFVWDEVEEDYDLAFFCASSGRGGEAAYVEVFLRGVNLMNSHLAKAKRLFISSTSVYGQTQGEIVTEELPCLPTSITSKTLAMAEKSVIESPGIVVRSSGIYGPGRGALWEKFKRGEAMIEGDGLRWINQIHQRDLVAAMVHLANVGTPGEIYNASDDTPVTYLDFYKWCSAFLDKPMPPFGPVNTERKRGLTNKRVSNVKLRGTGWSPIYPSFREGLA